MKTSATLLLLTFALITATGSCAATATSASSSQTVLVGSTPGTDVMRSVFSIRRDTPVDFIRWNLTLDAPGARPGKFVLNIAFGEGKPNTNGFINGGAERSFQGTFAVIKSRNFDVYKLVSDQLSGPVSMLKLSEDIYHLLTPDDTLMVGTAGWSFTLSRKYPSNRADVSPASWNKTFKDLRDPEATFYGRTPCREFVAQYDLRPERECNKLKWKLTLFRDRETNAPAGYTLQRTLERPNVLTGKWAFADLATGALIVRLDPDQPGKAISLLVGDENLLFFLDKRSVYLTGNDDFSYTLNRAI